MVPGKLESKRKLKYKWNLGFKQALEQGGSRPLGACRVQGYFPDLGNLRVHKFSHIEGKPWVQEDRYIYKNPQIHKGSLMQSILGSTETLGFKETRGCKVVFGFKETMFKASLEPKESLGSTETFFA